MIPVKLTLPSPFNRENFDPVKLAELTENVRAQGVLQPILVRPVKEGEWFVEPGTRTAGKKEAGFFVMSRSYVAWLQSRKQGDPPSREWSQFVPLFFTDEKEAIANLPQFEIVAGERRWRAATAAELAEIPAIVRELTDREAIEIQIVENLQREDVRPLDEARSFKRLVDFGYSMEELVAKLNIGQSTIYGRLKLLELPETVLAAVESGALAPSHAELVAKVKSPEAREQLAKQILKPKDVYIGGDYQKESLSFREAKAMAEEAAKAEEKENAWQKKAADFVKKGYKVLTLQQSAAVFQWGGLKAGYVGVGDKCDLDPKERTWKELLGAKAPQAIAARDSYSGKERIIYARKAAEKALKETDHKFPTEKKISREEQQKRDREKQERETEKRYAISAANISAVIAQVEAREPNADYFRLILATRMNSSYVDFLLRRRGIKVTGTDYQAPYKALKSLIANADGKTLKGLLLEMILWGWNGSSSEHLAEAAKVYKVKLQTSGKKKGACGAIASVPGAFGSFAEDDDE